MEEDNLKPHPGGEWALPVVASSLLEDKLQFKFKLGDESTSNNTYFASK